MGTKIRVLVGMVVVAAMAITGWMVVGAQETLPCDYSVFTTHQIEGEQFVDMMGVEIATFATQNYWVEVRPEIGLLSYYDNYTERTGALGPENQYLESFRFYSGEQMVGYVTHEGTDQFEIVYCLEAESHAEPFFVPYTDGYLGDWVRVNTGDAYVTWDAYIQGVHVGWLHVSADEEIQIFDVRTNNGLVQTDYDAVEHESEWLALLDLQEFGTSGWQTVTVDGGYDVYVHAEMHPLPDGYIAD